MKALRTHLHTCLLVALATACGSTTSVPDADDAAPPGEDAAVVPGVDASKPPSDAGDAGPSDARPDGDAATPPSARIDVSAPSGPATNEAGGTVTFTVTLALAPKANVTVPLAVSKPTEASVDLPQLTFTPTNWNTPQKVTVKGLDDAVVDGDQAYTVSVGPATGAGSGYEGLSGAPVSLKNEDDDMAGSFVGAVAGTATEAGGTATFTVRLRTKPSADVTIPVVSSDLTEGTTDVAQLTFTPLTWDTPQTVTVTGVDDRYVDGPITYPITLGAATSADPLYQGIDPTDPMVTTTDDDVASLVVGAPSGTHTSERGGAVTFDVTLGARPTVNVVVPVRVSDATEARVSAASLTFTTANWETPQTVTVTGLADAVTDGPQPYDVLLGATTSADAPFAGLTGMVSLVNDDDVLTAYTDYSVNHILSAGQSNAIASGGTRNDANQGFPQFTFTGPHPTYTNLAFDTGGAAAGAIGPFTALGCGGGGCAAGARRVPVGFAPLQEGDRHMNYQVETHSTAMANRINDIALAEYFPGTPYTKHDVLVSNHGRSGYNYACLRKGGCGYNALSLPATGYPPFTEGIEQATWGAQLSAADGRTHVVRAVTFIHGEDDHYNYGDLYPVARRAGGGTLADYAAALGELQTDYEADVRAVTGQAEGVPLFVSQMQGWTSTNVLPANPAYIPPTSSPIPVQQYRAHKTNPMVVLVMPGYSLLFNDCLHFNGFGQRKLGEYFAKAYAKWVFEGKKWEPTGPMSITRAGAVVTVKYHVPVPPLVLDTTNVSNPGSFGFRYLTGGSSKIASGTAQTIQSVAVTAPDTITITLAAVPTGANQRLEYANFFNYNGTGRPGCPGPTQGVRGNVRDSDPATSSTDGKRLYNWGVTFELPVPYAGP
ncbi:MAG TPA: hypothetical protein PLR99_16550 [Polyangiaceae bacterium]|nr:hypothetical protein [Polyangiaceae bacterium]